MDIIVAILGSSVLSSIITAIFGHIQGKKQDTLNYISDERKNWREKVRIIAENIKKSQFQGEGKKNICNYLNQLQMNINTYGIFDVENYVHDGHIWEIMDILQSVDNEKSFEKNKTLLLKYISLMLKEDWERSKNEVKGYSKLLSCIVLHSVLSVLLVIYYFFILNLENIWLFIGLEIANIIFVVIIRFYFLDEILLILNSKKSLTLKAIKKNQRKFNIKCVILIGIFVMYFIVGAGIIFDILPNNAVKNMKYDLRESEKLKVYTGLNEIVIPDFEKELEKCLKMDIEIAHNKTDIKMENESRDYDTEIEKILKQQIFVASYIVVGVFTVEIFAFLHIMISLNRNQQNKILKNSVTKIKYLVNDKYINEISGVYTILEKILEMDNGELKKEQADKLLGLGYTILENMRSYLNKKYNIEKMNVDSFEKFNYIENLAEGINIIDGCIEKIKKVPKKDMNLRRNRIVEIKEYIEKLKGLGDIYNIV